MPTKLAAKSPSDVAQEREIFKYYQPLSSKYDPNSTPLPRSSHDAALNSFAQCAALRLNAKYCIISLFTRDSQYIIAEATKTLSLQSENVHDKFDQLWRGVEVVARQAGPSSGAFSFFCKPERPNFIVFPNLFFDDTYSKLPYVSGPPGMRFYAAVPITSPLGIIIGTFAVFDTVPRNEIIVTELQFLKDMAVTTMQHLEICKTQEKSSRAERMIKGLGLYIEGKSSLRDWWLVTGHKSQRSFKSNRRHGRNLGQLADEEFGCQAPSEDRIETLRSNLLDNNRPLPPNEDDDSVSQTLSTVSAGELECSGSVRLISQDKSTLPTSNSTEILDNETSEYGDTSTLSAGNHRREHSHSDGSRLQEAVLTSDLKDTFSRASNLIRESMSIEGCLFLDASVGSFGGRSEKGSMQHKAPSAWKRSNSPIITSSSDEENTKNRTSEYTSMQSNKNQAASSSSPLSRTVSGDGNTFESILKNTHATTQNDIPKSLSRTDTTSSILNSSRRLSAAVTFLDNPRKNSQSSLHNEMGPENPTHVSPSKTCGILGYSTSNRSSLNLHLPSDRHLAVRESFLQSLLKRYPHGRVFDFDEEGNLALDEEEIRRNILDNISAAGSKTPAEEKSERRRYKRKTRRNTEARQLVDMLPGVRSVAFYPLWDSHKEMWIAGCLVWSTEISRVLDPDDDLVYLAAFGNSIMAEVSRLNALVAAQMKINFVSSISHELRSPLHGILASAEFLQDTNLSSPQADMVITINACGRTLLDTIDHVLDFAKLNATAESKSKKSKKSKKRRSLGKLTPVHTQSDISVLTEEVLESVYAGHKLNKSTVQRHEDCQTTPDMPQVSLIVDISGSSSWMVNMEPGAWRRVLMNIVSNSLKYTENGYIKVALEKTRSTTNPEAATVVLSVSDSGKGISKSFLQHHLFTPFAQEDSLCVGTGLGLSIVWQIVQDLGGSIDFQSEQGIGTEVKITLPVVNPSANALPLTTGVLNEVQAKTQGMKASLIGFNAMPVEPTGILSPEVEGMFFLRSSVSKLLADWFGMNVVHSPSLEISTTTISCVMESSLSSVPWNNLSQDTFDDKCLMSPGLPSKPVLIVICNTLSHDRSFTARNLGGYSVAYVQQPLGPQKLAFTLARCFAEVAAPETYSPNQVGDVGYFHQYTNTGSRNKDLGIPLKSPRLEPPSPSSIHSPTFILPVANEVAQTCPPNVPIKAAQQMSRSPQIRGGHPQNVLLVEDNAINLKLLITYMQKLGLDYAAAVNGLEAFNMFRNADRPFDIILMDVSMPVMDGMQSTRLIRKFEHEKNRKPVTIIALTGAASEAAKQAAFSAGIDLFLTKPVPMRTLKTILEENEEDMQRLIRSQQNK